MCGTFVSCFVVLLLCSYYVLHRCGGWLLLRFTVGTGRKWVEVYVVFSQALSVIRSVWVRLSPGVCVACYLHILALLYSNNSRST